MKKRHQKQDKYQLVLGCLPRISFFDHRLPLPNAYNGGYLFEVSPSVKTYSYCPIDLSVALLQSHIDGSSLTNLKQFFIDNKYRPVEQHIHLTVLDTMDNSIVTNTITAWKYLRSDLELNLVRQFEQAGRLTFKE